MDMYELTVAAASLAMRKGQLSSEAYVDKLLARAKDAEALNVFIYHQPDEVREAARRSDKERNSSSRPMGVLHGIPIALKDNIDAVGMPTTAGTPSLRNHRPLKNAPIVQRLLDEGAILFGKTNMHELAYGITNNNAAFGAAHNPYNPDYIPGGSSGGTGAAIGSRIVPAGLGTDTGGSLRIPAALCGVVGFRPTTGRWSQLGIVPISHSRDTPGPMARSVEDCALLDRVVTGNLHATIPATLEGLRIGVPRGYFWDSLDDEVQRILESTLAVLRDAGVVLVEADVADVAVLDGKTALTIALYETITDIDAYLKDHSSHLTFPDVVDQVASQDVKGILQWLSGPGKVTMNDYLEALLTQRMLLQQNFRNYFERERVDAIIFPTTPLAASRVGENETVVLRNIHVPIFAAYTRNTSPGSVAGLPGLSIPAGMTSSGLPVGVELDGPAGSDTRLLSVGMALEALLPKIQPPSI